MEQVDLSTEVENRFDRVTYQSDAFMVVLVVLVVGAWVAGWTEWIPLGTGGTIATVLLLFLLSWIYTNARRRGCGGVKSVLFAAVAVIHPLLGVFVYLVFRPRQPVVTFLPPSTPSIWPVFSGPVWIFTRAPFRFLIKLGL
jgi:hypothetical protein